MKTKNNNQDKESDGTATVYRAKPRKNGWSSPLHPLQFVAWFFLIVFNVYYHGIIVPVLPYQIPAYTIPGVVIIFHIIVHIMCVSIDPADPNVRKKKVNNVKAFDRSEHSHVIENSHCYLCEVPVGGKSKHCSSCNKCVSDFDHHCKWLNNCVGERNYRLFIMCLSSAFITCFIVCAVCIYVGIAYWVEPRLLHPEDDTSMSSSEYRDGLKMFGQAVSGVAFFTVVCIMVALLLLTVGLLGHLLGFHIYLICKNISTYEYIVLLRDIEMSKQSDIESQRTAVEEERVKKEEKKKEKKKKLKKKNKVAPISDQEEMELQEKNKKNENDSEENSSEELNNSPEPITAVVENNSKCDQTSIPLSPEPKTTVVVHENNNMSKKSDETLMPTSRSNSNHSDRSIGTVKSTHNYSNSKYSNMTESIGGSTINSNNKRKDNPVPAKKKRKKKKS